MLQRIGGLFGGFVTTVFVTFFVVSVIINGWGGIGDQKILITLFLVGLTIGGLITVARVFWFGPVTITTTATTVTIGRPGKKVQVWERSDADFYYTVERTYARSTPTGSIRRLLVTGAGEHSEIVCRWFSPSTFNALIADVAPINPGPPSMTPAAGHARIAAPQAGTTFVLDHRPITRERNLMVLVFAVMIICTLVIGFAFPSENGSLAPFSVLSVGPGIIIFLLLPFVFVRLRRSRSIPHTVSVSSSALHIDDRTISLLTARSIIATPADNTRDNTLVIVDQSGTSIRIYFGRPTPTGIPAFGYGPPSLKTFPGYSSFLAELTSATAHRPGLLSLNIA